MADGGSPLALTFGLIVAGAILLDKGSKLAGGILGSSSSTSTGGSTAAAPSTGGGSVKVPAGSLPSLPSGTALTGAAATAWAGAILVGLGAPVNRVNVQSLVAWFGREGGGGANNPMNTTLDTSGATGSINSDGVKNYATPAAGVTATVQTLRGGYPAIVAALKSGSGLLSTSGDVASELLIWSGGGYSSL